MELLKLEEADLQKLKAEAGQDAVRSHWTALIVTVLVLGVGGAVVWLAVSLSKMLRQLTKDLSDGSDQVASAARSFPLRSRWPRAPRSRRLRWKRPPRLPRRSTP